MCVDKQLAVRIVTFTNLPGPGVFFGERQVRAWGIFKKVDIKLTVQSKCCFSFVSMCGVMCLGQALLGRK